MSARLRRAKVIAKGPAKTPSVWRPSSCDRSMANKKKIGKVYLVGAGPGDLGLVTLRAKECIERADVIVYDYLANPEMLGWTREGAEIIYAGKKAGTHSLPQEEINKVLIDQAH